MQALLRHPDLTTTNIFLRLVPGDLRVVYDQAMPPLPTEPSPAVGGAGSAGSMPM